MLESCHDLVEVRKILVRRLAEVSLIGEIPLDDEDRAILRSLFQRFFTVHGDVARATERLRVHAVAFSCFLVHEGVFGYRGGNFWDHFAGLFGDLPQNVRTEWGRLFEDTVRKHGLADFRVYGGMRYVSAILGHGGIPDYCLDDFFDKLVRPAVSGKLGDDQDLEHLLEEWRAHASLFQFTDKPVRRFLTNGGKFAKDFLDRCLDMGRSVEEGQAGRSGNGESFGLPARVVSRFRNYLERRGPIVASAGEHRFRRPWLVVQPAAGTLILTIPAQLVPTRWVQGTPITVEVFADGKPLHPRPLAPLARDRRGKTRIEPLEIEVSRPFSRMKVEFRAGSTGRGPSRFVHHFLGFGDNTPRLLFREHDGKLYAERPRERRFWLLTPGDVEVRDGEVLEEHRCWHDHRCRLLSVDRHVEEVRLRRGQDELSPVILDSTSILEPRLVGCPLPSWPPVHGAGYEVFCHAPPELVIPVRNEADRLDRLEVRWRCMRHRGEEPESLSKKVCAPDLQELWTRGEQDVRIPLAHETLLGPRTRGLFELQVRGRLGQDRLFRFGVTPLSRAELEPSSLIPDLELGPRLAEVRLGFDAPVGLARLDRDEDVLASVTFGPENHEHVVEAARTDHEVHVAVGAEQGWERPVELAVRVPRLSWAYVGGDHDELRFESLRIRKTWQELQEANDPGLLVRADLESLASLTADLDRGRQRVDVPRHQGQGRISLRSFFDTIAGTIDSRHEVSLELSFSDGEVHRVGVLEVRTIWEVDDLRVETPESQDLRCLEVRWKDRTPVTRRVLRLWRRETCVAECPVEDGGEHATLRAKEGRFERGRYRLEFEVRDEWARPAAPVDPFAPNVRDLEILDGALRVLESTAQRAEAYLEAVRSGADAGEYRDPGLFREFFRHEAFVSRFADAVLTHWTHIEDSNEQAVKLGELLHEEAVDPGRVFDELAYQVVSGTTRHESLAVKVLQGLIRLGVLQQTWGRNVRKLVRRFAARTSGFSDRVEPDGTEIRELYGLVQWRRPDHAAAFLRELKAAVRVLRWSRTTSRSTVVKITCRASGVSVPLKIWYWYSSRRNNHPDNACLYLRHWNEVVPYSWGEKMVRYILSRFQRGIAWDVVDCTDETAAAIGRLARTQLNSSPHLYLDALGQAEKSVRSWVEREDTEVDHEA